MMLRSFGSILRKNRCYGTNKVFENTIPDDYFKDTGAPRIAVAKNGKTMAMYHPKPIVTYKKTIPIPRHDSKYNYESVDSHIEYKLEEIGLVTKPTEAPSTRNMYPMFDRDVLPTIMVLANMFHTTKHRWFPNNMKVLKQDKDNHRDRPFD